MYLPFKALSITRRFPATLTVVLSVGASTADGNDVIANTTSVTAVNETDTDTTNDTDTEATSVVEPAPAVQEVDLEINVTESADPPLQPPTTTATAVSTVAAGLPRIPKP